MSDWKILILSKYVIIINFLFKFAYTQMYCEKLLFFLKIYFYDTSKSVFHKRTLNAIQQNDSKHSKNRMIWPHVYIIICRKTNIWDKMCKHKERNTKIIYFLPLEIYKWENNTYSCLYAVYLQYIVNKARFDVLK